MRVPVGLKIGLFFFCAVDMPDAGAGWTRPQDRRYGRADFLKVYADLEAYSQAAERLEYESLWLAEHHFQSEVYEVVLNPILMAAFVAGRTRTLKFGAMFNVLPQWHPLRFAEDFALADVLTGGRMLCGIGRGTVPREAEPLGTRVGWNSDPDDVYNREVFESDLGLEYLTIFPHFPGMVREQAIEQMERFSTQIKPRLVASALPAGASA